MHPHIPKNCPFFRKGPKGSRAGSIWFRIPNDIPSQKFGFDIEPSVASGKLDSALVAIVAAYYWRRNGNEDVALDWEAWGGLCS